MTIEQKARDEFLQSIPLNKQFLLGLPARSRPKEAPRGPIEKDPCFTETMHRYDLSVEETRLLFVLLVLTLKEDEFFRLGVLTGKFGLETAEYIRLLEQVKGFIERKLVRVHKYSSDGYDHLNPRISIHELVSNYILFGLDDEPQADPLDIYSVLEAAQEIVLEHQNDSKSNSGTFMRDMEKLMARIPRENPLHTYVHREYRVEGILFLIAAHEKMDKNSSVDLQEVAKLICGKRLADRARLMKGILGKELSIFKEHILVLDEPPRGANFRNTTEYALSEVVARKLFLAGGNGLVEEGGLFRSDILDHIKPSEDKKDPIFYENYLAREVQTVSSAVSAEGYERISVALSKKGLKPGLTLLFHGAPGTGKTATVHEIAKRCGRDVLQVDMSQIRDMWVGNSEKNTKKIFVEYQRACEQFEKPPILLLNEADALLGRRMETVRTVEAMHNTMQNILLEELEKFQGILFATTNLIVNMDDAFSRRFLYKLEFPKPSPEIRKAIWLTKLPELTPDAAASLSKYELSGGQIDNIARRVFIGTLFRPEDDLIESLRRLCEEESGFKQELRPVRPGFDTTMIHQQGREA